MHHYKQVIYQGKHQHRARILKHNSVLPSQLEWEWNQTDHGWHAYWTTLPHQPIA